MRTRYLVSYDVANPRRLRRVHHTLRGFGDALQYSVFRCDLAPAERVLLIEALTPIIDHRQDQVLLIDLGPANGRGRESIEVLGRASQAAAEKRTAVIV